MTIMTDGPMLMGIAAMVTSVTNLVAVWRNHRPPRARPRRAPPRRRPTRALAGKSRKSGPL